MAVWNSAEKSTSITLSGGDLVATNNVTGNHAVKCTKYVGVGKWYWEVEIGEDGTTPQMLIGFGNSTVNVEVQLGENLNSWGYFAYDGKVQHNGSFTTYGNSFVTGDIIGVALDLTNGKAWFSKNNIWQNGGDPVAGTNPAFTGISEVVAPMWSGYNSGDAVTGKFDSGDWTYSAPSGYSQVQDPPVTWNPDDKHVSLTLDMGNLRVAGGGVAPASLRATKHTGITGKWYWEVKRTSSGGGAYHAGAARDSVALNLYMGYSVDSLGYNGATGTLIYNSIGAGTGPTWGQNDVISFAFDADAKKVWIAKNNVWILSGDPVAGTNPTFETTAEVKNNMYPGYSITPGGAYVLANFGATSFAYTPPTGFVGIGAEEPPEPPPGTVEVELNEEVGLGDTFEYNWETQQEETETVGLNDSWIVANPIYTVLDEGTGFTDVIESTSPQWTEIDEEVGLTDSLIGYSLSTGYSDEAAFSDEFIGVALTGITTEKVGIIDEWYVDIDKQISINSSYHEHITDLCTIETTFTAPKGEVVDSLEPIEAFAFGNDYTLGILEALEATVAGEVGNVCSVEDSLAALTCEAFSGMFVDASLEAVEANVSGVIGITSSCNIELPALQADIQGYITNVGNVDTSLPALEALVTAIVSGYGYVSADLLPLIGSITGITGTSIIVNTTLEALSADISGYVQPIGTVTANLSPIEAFIIGNISNRFDDYILKHVR